MLKVKIFMNSAIEEVLSFRCCSLHNQNLEMHVDNSGDETLTVPGRFDLMNESNTLECRHLFPPWEQKIAPGSGVAFYCTMDESEWAKYDQLRIYDADGLSYSFNIDEITTYVDF